MANRDAADLKRAEALSKALGLQHLKHTALDHMLASQRILAPAAGIVVRLRDVTGQALFQKTAVLDIATDSIGTFEVTLDVPDLTARTLQDGTELSVSVLAINQRDPMHLTAIWDADNIATSGTAECHCAPDR